MENKSGTAEIQTPSKISNIISGYNLITQPLQALHSVLSDKKGIQKLYISKFKFLNFNFFRIFIVQITPTRFWTYFEPFDFKFAEEVIASGNFGEVLKKVFKDEEHFAKKNRHGFPFANKVVAMKDPKYLTSWTEAQYSLSHEISCTVLLHPNLINYIGGVRLGNGLPEDMERIGIVMEYLQCNLRTAIQKIPQFKETQLQWKIAKQIASGMNFLHSLKPYVLHRDLRTPNILINENLECKISDFGISNNLGYEKIEPIALYTALIPPECIKNEAKFTTKGDVYVSFFSSS